MEAKERDDAEYLRDLRQAAGFNIAQLAAMANLSAGQMRQLEEGGDNLFYSPQIKAQSMRRVIRMLENPTAASPTKVVAEEPAPRTSANVIDDIIRLSEKNLSGHVVTSAVRRPARVGGVFLSVFIAVILVFVFIGWQSSQDIPVSKFTEWVNPSGLSSNVDKPAPVASQTPEPSPQAVKTEEVKTDAILQSTSATTVANAPETIQALPTVDATPKAVSAAKDTSNCDSISAEPVSVSAHSVSKPGNYVYVEASKPVQLCVDDGKLNRTVLNLQTGAGRSIHGTPPWTISSHGLSSVSIYFQGSKLMLPTHTAQRIYLAEQVVSR
ncbi:MAG: hypothetical protein EBW49_04915 [Betaproteobacteria bacterium]|nr:hypothetical protein [Betaproteobacteria bacterium]